MSIWFKEYNKTEIEIMMKNTMIENIGIEIDEIGDDFISGRLPVDHRTIQPAGLLHGGASVTLAETLGSLGSLLIVDPKKYFSVGLEINANHIRSAKEGFVFGKAKPLHIGRSTHVWEINIVNEEKKPICFSRLTIAIKEIG